MSYRYRTWSECGTRAEHAHTNHPEDAATFIVGKEPPAVSFTYPRP